MRQHLKRWGSLNILIFWSVLRIAAQTDTVELRDVIVSSFSDQQSRETSVHIEPITISKIEQSGAFNISDALAKIPGISQLSTGIGISKPVIHGLYGNRVLVLISGMRFDNQKPSFEVRTHSRGV